MRIYNGYKQEEINKNLGILDKIIKENKIVLEQIRLFIEQTGQSRSSFFRLKKYLSYKSDALGSHNIYNRDGCYFCNSLDNLIIHHIDKNRFDNSPKNRVTLCQKCHLRLHYLMERWGDTNENK